MSGYQEKKETYFSTARVDIESMLPNFSSNVLEIGCATGNTLKWLKETGRCNLTHGFEFFESAANQAKNCCDKIFLGDAEKIIHLNGLSKYDLILCLDVLEHMYDPWTFVKALSKRLDQNGVMIVSLPNIRHLKIIMPLLFKGKWNYTDAGILDKTHLRFFTLESSIDLLTVNELKLIQVKRNMGGISSISSLVNLLTFGVFRELLTTQYLLKVSYSTE